MKYKALFFVVLTWALYSCGAGSSNSDEKLLMDAFNNYKTAVLNDDGKGALECVDTRTIKYYNDILEKVKTYDSTKVSSLSTFDKLMLLTIRHRATADEILSFDGSDLLIFAVENGMIGKNSVSNNSLKNFEINGDFAKGQMVAGDVESPYFLEFHKEQESWKIDLTSLFTIGRTAFKQVQEQSGMDVNDYLFMLLEMSTGVEPDSSIWLPVVANNEATE